MMSSANEAIADADIVALLIDASDRRGIGSLKNSDVIRQFLESGKEDLREAATSSRSSSC